MRTLYCWVLSKEVSSTIFKVFGMTRPGIEPRSHGQLVNTLPTRPMTIFKQIDVFRTKNQKTKQKKKKKKNKNKKKKFTELLGKFFYK